MAPIFCCCLSLEESACLAFIGGKTRIAGTKRELFFYFTQLCLLDWAIKEVCSLEAFLFVEIELITLKFIFSKKATKINEIFTVDLTICSTRN